MSASPLPSGTVTFLFTDIEGSTQRWDRNRSAMQEAVRRHDAILRGAIESKGGRVFKTIGDAFCAVFARAEEAVAAALSAQHALHSEDFGEVDGLRVRMALHTGTADERDGDYYGPTLNRVARLLSIGHGGQVLLTRITAELVRGHLPPGVGAHDMGVHKLKDLSEAELVHQLLSEGLQSEFPPLRSAGATPNNLPAQVSSFVGRETESAAVMELLGQHRLVTLLGTGGIGKTRLSLHVAGELLERFSSGVWFVEFAPLTDAGLVADSILSAAGVTQSAQRPAFDTLTAHFKNETALLVFDNCEHLVGEIARVSDELLKRCAKIAILASSREPLGVPGEQAYRMPTLGAAEAAALFVERAKTADQRFAVTAENEPVIAEICRRLDGIALAIELAAARVKVLSPKALLEKLDDRFRVLGGGSRTLLPRQQTLRALIDWSYDLLNEAERALFRRLAIFSGGFTLELCAATCADESVSEFDVMDLLAALVDKSLISVELTGDEKRYYLLESIREYARERLVECGELQSMSRAHARAYTEFAEKLESEWERMSTPAWSALAKPELENWRSSLSWAFGEGAGAGIGPRMAAALRPLWTKFAVAEGRRWTRLALQEIDGAGAVAARLHVADAHLSIVANDYKQVLTSSNRALELLPDSDAFLRAQAHMFVGAALGPLGDLEQGEAFLHKALEAFRAGGARRHVGVTLQYLAVSRMSKGDVAGARPLLAEALELFRHTPGAERSAAHSALALAEADFQSGDVPAALELAREALATDLALENVAGAIFDRCNIAAYMVALDRPNEALKTARETLTLALQEGIDFAVLLALQHAAAAAARLPDRSPDNDSRIPALLGFVDKRFADAGFNRYFTEEQEYRRAVKALEESLGTDALKTAMAQGSLWSDERAVSEARLL